MKPKKIEFAPAPKVKQYQKQIDALILIMAQTLFDCAPGAEAEDWADYCFVSDESTLSDFSEADGAEKLSARLGFAVARQDYIWEIAARMAPSN